MNAPVLGKVAPLRQAYWDWRAAGNFIGGGSGAGALVYAAAAPSGAAAATMLGLALVCCGLLCVWFEIGRPWRALNVYLHPQSSWMTREALVAPLLFAAGVAGLWSGARPLLWLVAGLALIYAYCQARMLNGGRGIPAWRHPRVVPLMIATGLAEGTGFGIVAGLVLQPVVPPAWTTGLLVGLVVVRAFAYMAYRRGLERTRAPRRALDALSRFGRAFAGLNAAAVVLAAVGALGSGGGWPAGAAALLAIATGWWLKFTIVVRAAYTQGFALPTTPVRGSGGTRAGARPGW
jgi:phenylacetyl-CoA:acceptor oxidoreductase 26-kDa subunit